LSLSIDLGNTDLKPTLAADPKANSHTNPHPDLNPDPNITPDAKPNANAEVHPKDGTLQFLESAQKRYIRFFQSMYYVGAHADIPTIFQRSHLSLPRPLQKVPPGVPSKSMEEIMIHGPGSPTPISQAFEPLLSHFPPAPNPSLSKVATADCEHVVNRPSRMGWTYLPEVGDGSVAVAGLRKHHYAGLRSRAREEGRKSMEKKKRMAKRGRRDDHGGGNEDGGRERSDSGGGPDDEAGDGNEDGDTAGDGEGEEGGRGGRRRDDAGAKDDGDSSDPITSTMDQRGRADTLRKTSLALVDPLRFPNIPPSSDELSFAEIDSLPSTPGLTRDSYPSDGGSSICTKLERYRNDLRGMGVSIKLVGPEQMDRIVHRITTGQVVTSSSVTTLDVLGDEGKTSLEESRDGGQRIKSTRWPNLNEYGVV